MQAGNSAISPAGGDHLGGVLQASFGHGGAAQHAGHFMRAGALIEQANLGLGPSRGFSFIDQKMLIGKGRYLGQMSYAENLLAARQCLEFLTDCFSGAAADADVDLVEDQSARCRCLPRFG